MDNAHSNNHVRTEGLPVLFVTASWQIGQELDCSHDNGGSFVLLPALDSKQGPRHRFGQGALMNKLATIEHLS